MRVREEKEVGDREKDIRGSEGGRREREVRGRERERESGRKFCWKRKLVDEKKNFWHIRRISNGCVNFKQMN